MRVRETTMESTDYDGSYESTTTWIVSNGSLLDSIAFESSVTSAAIDGSIENAASTDSAVKSPLLLLRPSQSSDPCEITITFAQRHEVRQVYVRSTARVYEIYCVNRLGQSNEYLCTVRCGIAARGDEVLQASVVEGANLVGPQGLEMDDGAKRIKDSGSGGTSEDDWIKVKASDSSMLTNAKGLPVVRQGRMQDLYEATAETNDIEPCISITIRFLSHQDKGSVLVDEVYIFGEPADPSETEQEPNGMGNSAGNALMAMFMPTLLQLSRAKDANREREKQASNESDRMSQGTVRKSDGVDKTVNGFQHGTNLGKTDDHKVNLPTTPKVADHETSQGVSGVEIKPASPSNHVEMILHHLVHRVSRIEDILTRFEHQMLEPMKSINTRLQHVEQKLEELSKNSTSFEGPKALNPVFSGSTSSSPDIELDRQTSDLGNQHFTSCTRIVAPEFSSSDAELDSSYDIAVSTHEEDDNSTAKSLNSIADPLSDDHLHLETEVIAAESEIRKEESDHSIERESSEVKPKHSLSINDALASALAGFLSSTSTTDRKYSQALVVKAPEFSNEDYSESEQKDPSIVPSDKTSDCLVVTEKDMENAEPTYACSASAQNESVITVSPDVNSSEIKRVDKSCDHSEAGDNDGNAAAKTESSCYTEEEIQKKPENHETSDVVDKPENLFTAAGGKGEPKINDALQSILRLQHTSSSLDFETSVLDVKFNSGRNSDDNKAFFEALLNNTTPESITALDCINDYNRNNLISVDDGELQGPPTDTLSSADLDCYKPNCLHLNMEAETQLVFNKSDNEEAATGSLF